MRESAANIDALRSLGAKVDYHAADVTDTDAVKQAVAGHDTLHGVIHAAGLEMSQFIPKKKLKDFQRVVDVKVKGMLNLLSTMESREYGFFCTFSSVTARFGNEGQADYTAANDLIAKMTLRQQQLFPQRNFKVYDWTAWSGAGMATNPTVVTVLKEREYYCLTKKSDSDKETNTYQLQLVDKEGNLYIEVIDFKMVKLNKLAQEDRIDHRVTFGVTSPA